MTLSRSSKCLAALGKKSQCSDMHYLIESQHCELSMMAPTSLKKKLRHRFLAIEPGFKTRVPNNFMADKMT